jgi:hypothetical protein
LSWVPLSSLSGRERLNEVILNYYETNMNFMVEAMRFGLKKIEDKLEVEKTKGRNRSREYKAF